MILASSLDDLSLISFKGEYSGTIDLKQLNFKNNVFKYDNILSFGNSCVGIFMDAAKSIITLDSSTFEDNLTT